MKTSTWAKVAGWAQFAVVTFGQVAQQFGTSGTPHGAWNWVAFAASLGTAVAVHGAANTDGAK